MITPGSGDLLGVAGIKGVASARECIITKLKNDW